MTEFPKPRFEIAEEDLGDRVRILTAAGEIHVTTAPELAERLGAALAAGRTRLVLDFTGIEFIDSTGLSVLLNALRRVDRANGALALACTNPTVLRLFEITHLDATFALLASREEALAAVGDGAGSAASQAAGSEAGAP